MTKIANSARTIMAYPAKMARATSLAAQNASIIIAYTASKMARAIGNAAKITH